MVELQPKLDARPGRRRLDAEADRGEIRIRLRMEELDRLARSDGPLDVDRRRLAERDVEAELVRQRRLDHFLLHLAVERDRELPADVVLPYVDQRILLGELRECDPEPCTVVGIARDDDRLERRRRELVRVTVRPGLAEPVADLDPAEPPELRDLTRGHGRTLNCRPALGTPRSR